MSDDQRSTTPDRRPRTAAAWIAATAVSLLLAAVVWLPLERTALPELARFVGRLHPMVLHLPIGLLAGLVVLEMTTRARRSPGRDAACATLLWLAALTAVPTAIAGSLLATEGGFPGDPLDRHRWLGGAAAVLVVWLVAIRPRGGFAYGALLAATLGVLAAAGHAGASLTHGAGYLDKYAPWRAEPDADAPPAADAAPAGAPAPFDELAAFADVLQPLFAAKCVGCHGPEKQKAELRLDGFAALMAGGEDGPVVVPGAPASSPLIDALLRPLHDDAHMPPDGKPQPTADELEVLWWWVASGAPENATLGVLPRSPRTDAALRAVLDRPAAQPVREPDQATEPAPAPAEPEGIVRDAPPPAVASAAGIDFLTEVRPVLDEHCFRCHGPDKEKGDVRLDTLDPDLLRGSDAETWKVALDMIQGAEMPPDDEPQPGDAQRRLVVDWLTASLDAAADARRGELRTVLRRLNRAQYTNTLQELLGVGVDFGRVLPDDGKSRLGFSNSGEVLQASPLHIETYQAVARTALEDAIALGDRPPISRYRVTFGKGLGKDLVAGRTGGYQAVPLDPEHFVVEILDDDGRPRDGATDEEREALDAVRRRISVGLRGSSQDRFRIVDEGMILFSALPHVERVPKAWQGPSPNLKLELQRCFPERGDFVMRVRASRGYVPATQEQLLVDLDAPVACAQLDADGELVAPDGAQVLAAASSGKRSNLRMDDGDEFLVPVDVPKAGSAQFQLNVPDDGFYQVDLVHPPTPKDRMPSVRLSIGKLDLDLRPELTPEQLAAPRAITPLGVAGLRSGRHALRVGGRFFVGFSHVVVTRLPDDHPQVVRLTAEVDGLNAKLDGELPAIRALVGTRTDDGMDYKTFDEPQEVAAPRGQPETYTFQGRLENLPIPEPESGDTEVLSGIMLIGLWNDHLVKAADQTGPPLLVESIEVEAPHLPVWPPPSHTRIFFDSPRRGDRDAYTREVLERFMERAFRRPLHDGEVDRYLEFWRELEGDFATYEEGVREVLVAVLCSPNFLFLAEPVTGTDEDASSGSGDDERLTEHALASRLSYFLWNSPPDRELLELAGDGELRDRLLPQVDRMLDDPRAERMVRAFAREWLRLDRLERMTVNVRAHPAFTRFVKRDMGEETCRMVLRVLREDLSVFTLVDSDFAMLNQNLAEFYGIEGVVGPRFRPVPVTPAQRRGGLLSQGAFLVGHSDGTWPHPIKRAVWLKQKILGESPPPPPPNVPALDPETPGFEKLTLRQQLELHRDKPSCADCHRKIDPYGLAFEEYSAVGLLEAERRGRPVEAATVLPDGTPVDGVDALKRYVLDQRPDAFAAALIEYLFAYALGRDTSFADDAELGRILDAVQIGGFRMRAVIRGIVSSHSFTHR